MAKQHSKNQIIQNAQIVDESAYVTWGDDLDSKEKALKASSESLSEYNVVERTTARRTRLDFSNLDTNVGGRPGLTRNDYYAFRPEEAVPTKIKGIIYHAL